MRPITVVCPYALLLSNGSYVWLCGICDTIYELENMRILTKKKILEKYKCAYLPVGWKFSTHLLIRYRSPYELEPLPYYIEQLLEEDSWGCYIYAWVRLMKCSYNFTQYFKEYGMMDHLSVSKGWRKPINFGHAYGFRDLDIIAHTEEIHPEYKDRFIEFIRQIVDEESFTDIFYIHRSIRKLMPLMVMVHSNH